MIKVAKLGEFLIVALLASTALLWSTTAAAQQTADEKTTIDEQLLIQKITQKEVTRNACNLLV